MRRRDELCQKLNKKILDISTRPEEVKRLQTEMYHKYFIPIGVLAFLHFRDRKE